MRTRSRAAPWFGARTNSGGETFAQSLARALVSVDRLLEAGSVASAGRLLTARIECSTALGIPPPKLTPKIKIYSGPRPAKPEDLSDKNVLLVTIPLVAIGPGEYVSASAGEADTTGTATFYRFFNEEGTPLLDDDAEKLFGHGGHVLFGGGTQVQISDFRINGAEIDSLDIPRPVVRGDKPGTKR